jgi:probable F420-dependent oxidoreductase
MRYGFYLPTRGPLSEPEALGELVREGERMGFTTIVIADHIVFPTRFGSAYPYTLDGSFPGQGDALEQLALMSFVAGISRSARLVTSVMVVPHRNPLVTAKMLATIDVLSKGRVTVGCGVGWLREEFEALGAPDFDQRGRATDEYIRIFKKCWTEDPVSHDGEFCSFRELRCVPHPVQKPHPPIWIGGHSKAALRRVARLGDGWHPVGATAASPLPPDEFKRLLDELRRLTEAEGRDFAQLAISMKAPSYDPGTVPAGQARLPFTGEPARIADDINTYASLGVEELIFDFRCTPLAEMLARMDNFMQRVAPLAA